MVGSGHKLMPPALADSLLLTLAGPLGRSARPVGALGLLRVGQGLQLGGPGGMPVAYDPAAAAGAVTCARMRDPQAPDLNRVHRVRL